MVQFLPTLFLKHLFAVFIFPFSFPLTPFDYIFLPLYIEWFKFFLPLKSPSRNPPAAPKISNLYIQKHQNQNPKIFRGWNFKTAFLDFQNFLGVQNSKSGFQNWKPGVPPLNDGEDKTESRHHILKVLETAQKTISKIRVHNFSFSNTLSLMCTCACVRLHPKMIFEGAGRRKNGFARI